jgi:hypothetical protein
METSIEKEMDLGRLRGSIRSGFDSCERPKQRDDIWVDGCGIDLHKQLGWALVGSIQGRAELA